MEGKRISRGIAKAAAAALVSSLCVVPLSQANAKDQYKVFLNMSYSGN